MNIRMSSKGKRPLRSLTPGDKIIAIQRIHDGESKASVARDIGVPESTLRGWCKNEDKLRFMSRQSSIDNMPTDSVTEKVDIGPPDKRRKIDTISLPLNFSNKMPFETANGLDYSTNKALSDITLHGMTLDYAAFTNVVKNKVFGTEMPRSTDISLNTINSPLSNLSHLGIGGMSQSPLAINFNEISSNLNLLAQLNPSLAAMTGLNTINTSTNTLHNVKSAKNIPKSPQQLNSSQNDTNDRHHGLAVKNWANQRNTPANEVTYEMNLTQSSTENNKMKCPSPSIAPSLGCSIPHLQEDPLLYWLKSQQAILGLSNLYAQSAPPFISPPIRSSTPQQSGQTESTPQTPLTPSSTPSGSLDDKNAAWFNWCKAFGATLNSLNSPVSSQINTTPSHKVDSSTVPPIQTSSFENILYSQLTKETPSSPSMPSQNKEHLETLQCEKNEDNCNAKRSPLPTPAHSPIRTPSYSPAEGESKSSIIQNNNSDNPQQNSTLVKCKDVLDNLLFKMNKAEASKNGGSTPSSIDGENETVDSYISMKICNNNDLNASNNNNNNNSNKTDEEESKMEKLSTDLDDNVSEAIIHGEKFLNWLEKCSNPRVTTVHLMQLRFLIASIKSGISNENCSNSLEYVPNDKISNKNVSSYLHREDNNFEENHRRKFTRRK